jgi:hypothetical protein
LEEDISLRQKISLGFDTIQTGKLSPIKGGTKLNFFIRNISTDITEELKQKFIDAYNETGKSVLNHLEEDAASGTITFSGTSTSE